MPLINSIFREWRRAPPLRETAAAFFGYKAPPEPEDMPDIKIKSFDLEPED